MTEAIKPKAKRVTKKEARQVVYEKIAGALAEFKGQLSEKKFDRKVKKASKLFAVDIAQANNHKEKKEGKKKEAQKS